MTPHIFVKEAERYKKHAPAQRQQTPAVIGQMERAPEQRFKKPFFTKITANENSRENKIDERRFDFNKPFIMQP